MERLTCILPYRKWIGLPIGLIIFIMFFSACALPNLDPFREDSSGGGTVEASHEPSDGKGVLFIDVSYQTAKTLLPDFDMNIASFEFRGNGPNGENFSANSATTPVEIPELSAGDWVVFADAKNADNEFIAVGETTTTIHAGNTQTVSITVTPLDGQGTLDLTVNWTPGDVGDASIDAQLVLKSGSTIDLSFQITEPGKATMVNDQIPTGYHTVSIQLLDNGLLTMGAIEVVRIAKDQTTSGAFDFYDINQPGGDIVVNITPEMNDPIDVLMSGQVDELVLGDEMTVMAIVPAFVGSVVYVWYINGESEATGNTFMVGSDLPIGVYRLDVTAYTVDGKRAGSTTHNFHIIQGAEVTLEWDPNSEPDLAGYKLYYGSAGGDYSYSIDVGNQTTYTLTGLQPGATYYAAATAYNLSGLESDYSNEINFLAN